MKKKILLSILSVIAFIGCTLSAQKVAVKDLAGTAWNDYMGPFHTQKMDTQINTISNGILTGTTILTNKTHFKFHGTTELYLYKNLTDQKPAYILNIKSSKLINGLRTPKAIGWASNQAKQVYPPGVPHWQFWKVERVNGVKTENWQIDLNNYADASYVEIKNAKAAAVIGNVAAEYFTMGKMTVDLAEAAVNGEKTDGKINELVNFAADSLYIKYVNKNNASQFKNLLTDFITLAAKDIAPLVGNNKDDVKIIIEYCIQLVSGDKIDINKFDIMLDNIKVLAMDPANTEHVKAMLTDMAKVLTDLSNLNIIKGLDNYIDILNKTAAGITGDTMISPQNAVLVFDSMKIAVRIIAKQDLQGINGLAVTWFDKGLRYYLENSKMTDTEINALRTVVLNGVSIASKENGKYIQTLGVFVKDMGQLIQKIGSGADVTQVVAEIKALLEKHQDFITANKQELKNILTGVKTLLPDEKAKAVIDILIKVIDKDSSDMPKVEDVSHSFLAVNNNTDHNLTVSVVATDLTYMYRAGYLKDGEMMLNKPNEAYTLTLAPGESTNAPVYQLTWINTDPMSERQLAFTVTDQTTGKSSYYKPYYERNGTLMFEADKDKTSELNITVTPVKPVPDSSSGATDVWESTTQITIN